MTTQKYINWAGLECEEKKLQKPIFDGDASKLNVAYFARRTKYMRHIVSYDKKALKTLQLTDNHTSVCGREFWVKAFGNDIQNFEHDKEFVCAKCLYNLGFLRKETCKTFNSEGGGAIGSSETWYYVIKEFKGYEVGEEYYHSCTENKRY